MDIKSCCNSHTIKLKTPACKELLLTHCKLTHEASNSKTRLIHFYKIWSSWEIIGVICPIPKPTLSIITTIYFNYFPTASEETFFLSPEKLTKVLKLDTSYANVARTVALKGEVTVWEWLGVVQLGAVAACIHGVGQYLTGILCSTWVNKHL